MEKFICLFLPSFLFIKKIINKNDDVLDIMIKFSKLCLGINFISFIITKFIFNEIFLNNDILFLIKYIVLSIIIGFFITIIYLSVKNKVSMKVEVVYEKENKKSKKNK